MNEEEMIAVTYLQELYNTTQGNTETQVSMYDLGSALGLEKTEAGRIAEELMVLGFIELKTLAGGISITDEGLNKLGISPAPKDDLSDRPRLSCEQVVTEKDRQVIECVCNSIKDELSKQAHAYNLLDQAVMDLRTIEIHLHSPAPKTAVVLELFRSIAATFNANESFLHLSGITSIIELTDKQ
ncbi:hypothetical protein [Desulforhopalus sp. IMCC35007]|uniref:hypothetical protein n=1 Tax=Desulforhopalus sp. IMCC35007 TaxID=2569543 RepID=UPI0010AECEB5|nr:hypothetical protein [Desulforhopalus sp. IMCC35007]TKB09973.1 hypothetical protein FCL48_08380 [Desulforhopalus sp. IMCC35007]